MLCLLVLGFFNGCKKDNNVASSTSVLSEDKDLQILSLLKDPSYMLSTITGMEGDDRFEKVLQEQARLQKELMEKYHLPAATAEITISKAIDEYRTILKEKGKKDEWRYEYLPKLSVKSLGNVKASGGWDGGTLPEVTVIGLNINTFQLNRDYLRMVDALRVEVRADAIREVQDFIMRVEDIVRSAGSAHNHKPTIDGLLNDYHMETFVMKQLFYGYEIECSRFKRPDPGAPPRPPLGGGGAPVTFVTKEIKTDDIKDPCLKNVIDEIKGRAFDPNAKDPDLAKIINNFDKNTNVKITVVQGNAIGPDGLPREVSTEVFDARPTSFVATITLDSERIFSSVTKEYLNVLFIHEIVHAYLDYSNKRDLNNHEYMRNNYVIPMTDYLVKHYLLDRKMAAALVMRGVLSSEESSPNEHDTTPKFQYDNLGNKLSEFDLVEAGQYKFGNYGTPKCD